MAITHFSALQQSSLKDLPVLLPPTPPIPPAPIAEAALLKSALTSMSPNQSSGLSPIVLPCQQSTHCSPTAGHPFTTALQDATHGWWPFFLSGCSSSVSSVGFPSPLTSLSHQFSSFPCAVSLVISSSITALNVISMLTTPKVLALAQTSSGLHSPKSNFLLNSYMSKSNNRVELNSPRSLLFIPIPTCTPTVLLTSETDTPSSSCWNRNIWA